MDEVKQIGKIKFYYVTKITKTYMEFKAKIHKHPHIFALFYNDDFINIKGTKEKTSITQEEKDGLISLLEDFKNKALAARTKPSDFKTIKLENGFLSFITDKVDFKEVYTYDPKSEEINHFQNIDLRGFACNFDVRTFDSGYVGRLDRNYRALYDAILGHDEDLLELELKYFMDIAIPAEAKLLNSLDNKKRFVPKEEPYSSDEIKILTFEEGIKTFFNRSDKYIGKCIIKGEDFTFGYCWNPSYSSFNLIFENNMASISISDDLLALLQEKRIKVDKISMIKKIMEPSSKREDLISGIDNLPDSFIAKLIYDSKLSLTKKLSYVKKLNNDADTFKSILEESIARLKREDTLFLVEEIIDEGEEKIIGTILSTRINDILSKEKDNFNKYQKNYHLRIKQYENADGKLKQITEFYSNRYEIYNASFIS